MRKYRNTKKNGEQAVMSAEMRLLSEDDYYDDSIGLSGHLKSDYKSDTMKEQYYRQSWLELCEEAGTKKTEDTKFMDILIQAARDTHEQKNKQKKKYFRWERSLLILTLVNTLCNSLKLLGWGDIWDMSLNLVCVALSALIAAVTSYELLISPKNMWLRHMSFYSKITTESDNLFGGGSDYESLTAAEKIKTFKSRIVQYTQEDYQNFFATMSGSKNFSQNTDDGKI